MARDRAQDVILEILSFSKCSDLEVYIAIAKKISKENIEHLEQAHLIKDAARMQDD